jgi:predicted DNA-binding transcriptional regulator YafY
MLTAWCQHGWTSVIEMRRADRLFEIIQVLRRARKPLSADAIGRELEVSKRTIYRDMAALISQRVPITGEAGVGYVLERGFDMPPLMLTQDEIDAAVLGACWVAGRGEPELAAAALSLLSKIEAVVPEQLKASIVNSTTSIAPVRQGPEYISSSELRRAIRLHRKLSLDYRTDNGDHSYRVVWPILLGYRDAGRLLAAWCELRQAFRYFRTDRMTAVHVLDDLIPERATLLRKRWQKAMEAERDQYADQQAVKPC